MNKLATIIRILFIISSFCFSVKSQDSLSSPYNEKLVQDYLKKFGTKGLVIGVIKDGVESVKGFGKINTSGKKEITPNGNTLFEIGSITKVFTTLLLADLVKKDSIQLNELIINLLPKNDYTYSKAIKNISVLNLATHTSGFPRITSRSINGYFWSRGFLPLGLYDYIFGVMNPYRNYDTTKIFKDLRYVKLENQVGLKVSYSNFGMTTLGYILTHKSKMTFGSLLKTTILDTLKMKHTYVDLPKSAFSNFADGHNKIGIKTPRWTFREGMGGAGSINSSVNDLMKFLAVNINNNNEYLHSLLEYCQTTQFKMSEHRDIGLAWIKSNSESTNNKEIIWHNGATGGFRSFLGFNTETKTGIVILSNSANDVDKLAIDILKILMEKKVDSSLLKNVSVN